MQLDNDPRVKIYNFIDGLPDAIKENIFRYLAQCFGPPTLVAQTKEEANGILCSYLFEPDITKVIPRALSAKAVITYWFEKGVLLPCREESVVSASSIDIESTNAFRDSARAWTIVDTKELSSERLRYFERSALA